MRGRRRTSNCIRIIGGRWRGRKLVFPPVPALRPSPDRVRETLFNWLQPILPDARCLDLFCGSGALGVEAASRAAASVTLVDRDRQLVGALREQLRRLDHPRLEVIESEVLQWLSRSPPAPPYDVVFLDPPYASDQLPHCCRLLEQGHWLAERAWVYLEAGAPRGVPELPATWTVVRSRRAGAVGYHLAVRDVHGGAQRGLRRGSGWNGEDVD